ncbi:hypothetical protein [Rhodanobacter thiooxydans]|uniref:hypothetical protein n=1 Tax=Rhodanobacter thiooxydans TaxID=416169 RepID=UPI0019025691|nr:hypothetical protein [Rhodanobacter thiooxydans]
MPASITASEIELFVQALQHRHGRDFSQYAPASLLRRGRWPAPPGPPGMMPPFTPAMAANG